MHRKLKAADILEDCSYSFVDAALDTLLLDSSLFPKSRSWMPNPQVMQLVTEIVQGKVSRPLGTAVMQLRLNVQSRHRDTLWINKLQGTLKADSLAEIPFTLLEPMRIAPGTQQIALSLQIPLDQGLLNLMDGFALLKAQGVADVSLKRNGSATSLGFDRSRRFDREQIAAVKRQVKESVVKQLVADWAGSFSD